MLSFLINLIQKTVWYHTSLQMKEIKCVLYSLFGKRNQERRNWFVLENQYQLHFNLLLMCWGRKSEFQYAISHNQNTMLIKICSIKINPPLQPKRGRGILLLFCLNKKIAHALIFFVSELTNVDVLLIPTVPQNNISVHKVSVINLSSSLLS